MRSGCKAHDDKVHRKLTGVSNKRILELPAEIVDMGFVLEVLTLYTPAGSRLACERFVKTNCYCVPSDHEPKYFCCSSVSSSISMPMVSSLRRATSSSISLGTL